MKCRIRWAKKNFWHYGHFKLLTSRICNSETPTRKGKTNSIKQDTFSWQWEFSIVSFNIDQPYEDEKLGLLLAPLVIALSKWERDLSSNDIHWKNYFKQIKFMCKENKLKEFYFKLVHRILVSKKELHLHLFGVSNNSNCTYWSTNTFLTTVNWP